MSKPSSTTNYSINNISLCGMPDDVDKTTLNWHTSVETTPVELSFYPPIVAKVDNSYYQVNRFDNNGINCFLVEVKCFAELLNLSISLKKPLFDEWIKIVAISESLKIDKTVLSSPFGNGWGKDDAYYHLFKKAAKWHDKLTSYIRSKEIPWKTIFLLEFLSISQHNMLVDFISKKQPSVQQFKKFVEIIRDNNIQSELYTDDINSQADNRSATRVDIEMQLKALQEKLIKLNSKLMNINIATTDQWESGFIKLTADINGVEGFQQMLANIETNRDEILRFLKLLESVGISGGKD